MVSRSALICVLVPLLFSACSRSSRSNSNPVTPAQPTGLTAQLTGPTEVTVFWVDNATDETRYEVERGVAGVFAVIATLGADTEVFVDNTVTPGETYTYRVAAFNAQGASDYSNTFDVAVPAPAPTLASITPSSGFAGGGMSVTVTGSGFADFNPGTNGLIVGGALASFIAVVDDSTMTAEVPAGTPGRADVQLQNLNGVATLTDAFTYFGFPPTFLAADQRLDRTFVASSSVRPDICASGANVYVLWEDYRNGDSDVYFNRSLDHGVSWLRTDVRVDTGVFGVRSERPVLACSGSDVYAVWVDDRQGGNFDVMFSRSTDAGATWSAETRLNTDAPDSRGSFSPQICADGDSVYVVWGDDRNGARDIYVASSQDRGATWATEVRVDADTAGIASSEKPQIACDGLGVSVVWEDVRSGQLSIYGNASTDGGQTWPSEARIDTRPFSFFSASNLPRLSRDGDRVHVVWTDTRDGFEDVYANLSTDGGATWQTSDVRLSGGTAGAAQSANPVICSTGGSAVFVAWEDRRNGDLDVYFTRSLDGGLTWEADRLMGAAPAGSTSLRPDLACSGNTVFLAWEEAALGGFGDIYLTTSDDQGQTWTPEQRLDTDGAGVHASFCPRIAVDGARVYTVWEDYRNAPGLQAADIFLNRNQIQPTAPEHPTRGPVRRQHPSARTSGQ